jgi:hypothetical protein
MKKNKEKTALTWFLDEVLLKQVFSLLPPINMKEWDKIVEMANKAKQMEKQQIIAAVEHGCDEYGAQKDGEEYYKESYE